MGSTLPIEGLWPNHQKGGFAGFHLGTAGTSLIYHAGQHLIGKGLRYLKTLRVRAGLQRGLARLKPGFTHRQWPRLTDYTRPFGLAVSYVFGKQSGPPSHCDLITADQAPLLPKIQG